MTIRIKKEKIEFVTQGGVTYELSESSEGFNFTGDLSAQNFYILFQGGVSGYNSGGGPSPSPTNTIDKFPFATDANATDVGNLTVSRTDTAGQSSDVSGYTSGGYLFNPPTPSIYNTIDKFPFASNADATDVGDLTVGRHSVSSQVSSVSGYTSAGNGGGNVIDKFPFATDANATDVGDLLISPTDPAGQSSLTHGYVSGDFLGNTIEKFPFATDANSTDVGDLSAVRGGVAGQSSDISGYTSGGFVPPSTNVIDKFPFATDASATDVGDLTVSRAQCTGQSSTENGYTSGGSSSVSIDKFPFAVDANATDVGDLTQGRSGPAGQQD